MREHPNAHGAEGAGVYDGGILLRMIPVAHTWFAGSAATLTFLLSFSVRLPAQKPDAIPAPAALIRDAAKNQMEDMQHHGWAVRYRLHRVDTKEDSLRDLVESKDGNIARTLERKGRPLTTEEDGAEQQRLRLITSEALDKRHRANENSDRYAGELISAMPDAMTYTLVPEQPQLAQFPVRQIVVDFTPREGFRPSSTAQSLLTGIDGRMWMDAATHHVLRIEIHVIRNLNLALGLLARVYAGGSLVYEQHPVGEGHYAYSHIDINVLLRELMVKTVPYHSTLEASDVTLLPSVPSAQEAVTMLLKDDAGKHP